MSESTSSAEQQCPTRFVEDTPTDVDAFGPHKQLADTLATMFASDEPGGKTVGLAGSYGSGKSTVVTLLRAALVGDSNCFVWVFDAWAHEGDPLRRTFLESLTVSLEEEGQGWTERNWEDELDELRMKRRRTETKTRPALASEGINLALMLLAAPLGLVLLNAGLRNGVTFSGSGDVNVVAIVGGILALLPVAYAVHVTVRCWRRERDWEKVAKKLSSIVVQKGEQDQQTISFETPDRTSLEFENYFIDLMRDVLSDKQRRLVLVIDNLDRVQPEDAAKIWATLRTFLDHGARARNEDWFRRLWTVIPYDQSGIRLVRPVGQEVGDEKSGERSGEKSPDVTTFLDKAIQIRFEVPAPLLPDWKRYFLELLGEALPEHPEADRHEIYSVIVASGLHQRRPLTPRLLKNVVNWIGALHRRHEHEIPLAHLAYYVALLTRERSWTREEILRQAVEGSLPTGRELGTLPEGARESLAAVVHSVDRERAAYLLLGKPIREALEAGDVERLPELFDRVQEPWPVVEHVLKEARDEWVSGASDSILRAAEALVCSGVLDEAPGHEGERVRREVCDAAESAERLLPTDEAAQGLSHVLSWADGPDTARGLYRSLATGLRQATNGAEAKDDANQRARAARAWRQSRGVFVGAGYGEVVAEPILLQLEFRGLAVFLGAVAAEGGGRSDLMSVGSDLDGTKLFEEVKQAVKGDEFGQGEAWAVLALCENTQGFEAGAVADVVADRLNANQRPIADRAEHLMAVLLGLIPDSDGKIQALGEGGHLAHLMHSLTGASDRAKARLIALYMTSVPDFTLPTNIHSGQQGHQYLLELLESPDEGLVGELERVLVEEGRPEHLVRSIEAIGDSKPLLMRVLGSLADSGEHDGLFTPEFTEGVWSDLVDYCDREILVGRIATDQWIEKLMESECSVHSFSLYAAVLAVRPEDRSLTGWVAEWS